MLNLIKKGPEILIFFTSYKCNCQCIMCHIWQKQKGNNELTLKQISNFFDKYLINNFVRIINLTGGEPTLDNKLENIIKIILKKCKKLQRIDIPTNGIDSDVTVDKIERILAMLFPYQNIRLTVTIALDGIGKIHEKIRGKSRIFEDVKRTIKGLKELTEIYPYFFLSLNTVINKVNYDKLDEIIDFAKNEQVYLNFTPAALSEIGVESVKANQPFRLTKNERLRVLNSIGKLDEIQNISEINKKFLIGIFKNNRRVVDCIFRQKKAILIEPNGDSYLCGNFKSFSLGNVTEDDFEYIWRKAKLPKNWREICSKCESNCYLEGI